MGQLCWRCRDVSGTTVDMADKAYKAKEERLVHLLGTLPLH